MASLCLEEPAADVAELEGSAKARRRSKVCSRACPGQRRSSRLSLCLLRVILETGTLGHEQGSVFAEMPSGLCDGFEADVLAELNGKLARGLRHASLVPDHGHRCGKNNGAVYKDTDHAGCAGTV